MSHRPAHRIRQALQLREILRTYRTHRLRPILDPDPDPGLDPAHPIQEVRLTLDPIPEARQMAAEAAGVHLTAAAATEARRMKGKTHD